MASGTGRTAAPIGEVPSSARSSRAMSSDGSRSSSHPRTGELITAASPPTTGGYDWVRCSGAHTLKGDSSNFETVDVRMFPDVQDTSERRAAMPDKRRDRDVLDPIAFTRLLAFQPYSLPAESGDALERFFSTNPRKHLRISQFQSTCAGGTPRKLPPCTPARQVR